MGMRTRAPNHPHAYPEPPLPPSVFPTLDPLAKVEETQHPGLQLPQPSPTCSSSVRGSSAKGCSGSSCSTAANSLSCSSSGTCQLGQEG